MVKNGRAWQMQHFFLGSFLLASGAFTSPSLDVIDTCLMSLADGNYAEHESKLNSTPYAYVVNLGNYTISICPMASDGSSIDSYGSCYGPYDPISVFNGPVTMLIYLPTPNLSFAYIANYYANNVVICPVNFDGSFAPVCTTIGSASIFNEPYGLAVNSFSNPGTTYFYVSNVGSNNVTLCQAEPCGLLDCSDNYAVGGSALYGLVLNQGFNLAYITSRYGGTNISGDVLACSINSDGSLETSCPSADGDSTLDVNVSGPKYITLNADASCAYIANFDGSSLTVCDINATNGELVNCSNPLTSSILSGPEGMVLTSDYLYIANKNSGAITICSVQAGDCADTIVAADCNNNSTGFSAPTDVFIY